MDSKREREGPWMARDSANEQERARKSENERVIVRWSEEGPWMV